jgi:hypothetical protein
MVILHDVFKCLTCWTLDMRLALSLLVIWLRLVLVLHLLLLFLLNESR